MQFFFFFLGDTSWFFTCTFLINHIWMAQPSSPGSKHKSRDGIAGFSPGAVAEITGVQQTPLVWRDLGFPSDESGQNELVWMRKDRKELVWDENGEKWAGLGWKRKELSWFWIRTRIPDLLLVFSQKKSPGAPSRWFQTPNHTGAALPVIPTALHLSLGKYH